MKVSHHRPITLELASGERVSGTLVHVVAGIYTVQVDDRFLEIHDTDVVQVVWDRLGPVASSSFMRPMGPLRIEQLIAEEEAPLAVARAALFPEPESQVQALVDGARVPGLLAALSERGATPTSLWGGSLTPEQAAVAPYLVPLTPDSRTLSWLIEEGLGRSWAVFLRSPATPTALLAHLRSFLRAASPAGREWDFRFYDPRVLRTYLETLNEREVAKFFGGAWCGPPATPLDLLCPICAAVMRPLSAHCKGCATPFGGRPAAPFLIEAILIEGEEPDRFVLHRPWPEHNDDERSVPVRQATRRQGLLAIRQEQADALSRAFVDRRFLRWAVGHLGRVFPERCQQLGELGVRRSIRDGLSRARQYGIEESEDFAGFLDLMFIAGLEFELDEPYYETVLRDEALSVRERLDLVSSEVQESDEEGSDG